MAPVFNDVQPTQFSVARLIGIVNRAGTTSRQSTMIGEYPSDWLSEGALELSPARSDIAHISKGLLDLASTYPWPEFLPKAIPDDDWRRREQRCALRALPILEEVLTDDRWLILQLHVIRGVITRYLAASVWNAFVIAVPAEQFGLRQNEGEFHRLYRHRGSNLFFYDCRRFQDRIIPCPRSASDAVEMLSEKRLAPHIVFTPADHAQCVSGDLSWAADKTPDAHIVGYGWHDKGVRDALLEFVKTRPVELQVRDDGWCLWREPEKWHSV
jgi:hypothetical protein